MGYGQHHQSESFDITPIVHHLMEATKRDEIVWLHDGGFMTYQAAHSGHSVEIERYFMTIKLSLFTTPYVAYTNRIAVTGDHPDLRKLWKLIKLQRKRPVQEPPAQEASLDSQTPLYTQGDAWISNVSADEQLAFELASSLALDDLSK